MQLPKIDQLGLQLQKFGVELKSLAQQVVSLHQHMTVLFAVVRVLKARGLLTDEEIEETLKTMKEEV